MRKLRTNEPLKPGDLDDLEHVRTESKIGKTEYIEQAKQESQVFGIFVRFLVGLDREVAKKLLGDFLQGNDYNANQIEFINLIINQSADHGTHRRRPTIALDDADAGNREAGGTDLAAALLAS